MNDQKKFEICMKHGYNYRKEYNNITKFVDLIVKRKTIERDFFIRFGYDEND